MRLYCIAESYIKIEWNNIGNFQELLPNLTHFESENKNDEKVKTICYIYCHIVDTIIKNNQGKRIAKSKNAVGYWEIYKQDREISIELEYFSGFPTHRMISSNNQTRFDLYLKKEDPLLGLVINSFIMFAFALNCIKNNTILVHASTVKKGNNAYAFLGASGIGKSTHSKLWIKYINDTELLNDDNPAIRLEKDNIYIYGTPWSGKTNCYKNSKAQLKGLLQLKQSKENKILNINGLNKYLYLLKSSSTKSWDTDNFNKQIDLISEIANKIPFFVLENLPNDEAVKLAYETFIKQNDID